ncbi:ABC transporter permease [Conyzicola nivalis]|uniref:ABC3 transporter permease C-terminal domain-containing protein n=1 Tax=Conyzicola nivalis TaxID=1477021 RepID=A0A916WMP8_9MICO|nr:ABC transporter permease [Conyzicola nivalis]GGB12810.1 hypothetical protein GCM10010979_28990 [Conyzicola nivalis]
MKHQATRIAARENGPRRRAPRAGSWLVGTTVRRTRAQWRLLLGVVAVAVLASVLVTTLSLLVSATEQRGVRGALGAIPAEQSDLDVRLLDPTIDLADATAEVTDAVASVYAPAATATVVGGAVSSYLPVTAVADAPRAPSPPTLAYFGEFDGVAQAATLVAGDWPGETAAGDRVAVAIPAAASAALSLGVGGTLVVEATDADVTAVVTGVFEPTDRTDEFWALDRLASAGYEPEFPNPFTSFYNPSVVFGPLVVGTGALASADLPVAIATLRYTPDFSDTTVAQLRPLLDRLATADIDILYSANGVAGSVFIDSDAAAAVSAVAAGLTVTRSTVVVVSLLLLVLAVAAMAQLARLYSDARAGERQLMRARGASRRNILALAAVEAAVIAVATAAATPPLASLAYRLLATQPTMVAAGMPPDAGIPPLTWLISAGIAVVFVLVLLAPLIRGDVSFAEGAQAAGRQRLVSGVARSGIDVALVVLAGIAYWQLQAYRTPVQESATLTVDPVLVAGPAIVLVAAALVCARLIPAASRLLERLGSGARGATVALASWELGRRPQRATAAVLLLSLTLAVGTFGLSFLDTWKRSQVDQAAFAVGAPVRVEADGAAADGVAAPSGTTAEPTLRRSLVIGGFSGDPDNLGGSLASVLALTPAARDLAADGQLGDLGGDVIADSLPTDPPAATVVDLPDGATGVAATVRFGDPEAPLEAVAADLTAVIENGDGRLVLLPLGRIDGDGASHEVSGELPPASATGTLRFAGLQVRVVDTSGDEPVVRGAPEPADVLLSDLAGTTASGEPQPVAVEAGDDGWFGSAAARNSSLPATNGVPDGWQLRLGVTVPLDLRSSPGNYALVGWRPHAAVPAVLAGEIADQLGLTVGTELDVRVGGLPTTIRVAAVAPLVPGAARTADLAGPTPALGGAAAQLAVVDTTLLTRSLVEAGAEGSLVDEWWVGVPASDARSFLDALPPGVTAVGSALLGDRLQEAPLRVATQAALWVAIAASTLLAAVGFGVHSAAGLRSRRLELAQLRAIGYSRRRLVGLVGAESLLMCLLGAVFGISIGVLLAWLVGPLVAVSPTGAPTVPSVVVEVPPLGIALLLAWIVAVLAAVVLLVARMQRFTEPAHLLREGAQP